MVLGATGIQAALLKEHSKDVSSPPALIFSMMAVRAPSLVILILVWVDASSDERPRPPPGLIRSGMAYQNDGAVRASADLATTLNQRAHLRAVLISRAGFPGQAFDDEKVSLGLLWLTPIATSWS